MRARLHAIDGVPDKSTEAYLCQNQARQHGQKISQQAHFFAIPTEKHKKCFSSLMLLAMTLSAGGRSNRASGL